MKETGLIQLFFGNGRGKTTAALGTALRVLGHGFKVHLIQFLKNGVNGIKEFEEYGELKALKKFSNFSVERFGLKEWVIGKPSKKQLLLGKKALKAVEKAVCSGKFDLVVIDECLYAVEFGIIKEKELINVLKKKNPKTEIILTGSHKRMKEIEKICDYVSEIKKLKHPFDKGIKARKGIEF
jgi:cob(I)alamin adenosyltransferase